MAKRIMSKAFPQGTSVSPKGISDDIVYSTCFLPFIAGRSSCAVKLLLSRRCLFFTQFAVLNKRTTFVSVS
jgi:hypothetical protein